jgi:DNA-directed RNA polymerase specialized sigma24 family protein
MMKLLDDPGTRQFDPLLLPFLRAPEAEAQEALGHLLTLHARPVIHRVLRRRPGLSGPEAGDLESEIVLLLIERLRRMRLDAQDEGIRDLQGYVAVVTYNAFSTHLKKRGPERPRGWDGEDEDPLGRLPDPAPDAATALERRTYLALLWEEIRQLPPRQAAALILNLRDGQGRNAVALLPLTGIATMREIARTLDMPAERFAEIWNRLPLEDAAIAESLGITRQQVINLRKSARERLARRMRLH